MADVERLPEYLGLAKNVRGLAVYDPDDPPEREFFTWLSRKHQYRNVGFTHAQLAGHPDVDLAGYKTFVELGYPFEELRRLVEAADDAVNEWVPESLVLASSYVTPLFVHEPALSAFDQAAVWRLRSESPLPEDQVLRHMRIAGYGMLDFHAEVAPRGHQAVAAGAVDAEQERREEDAREDGEERFWRLLEEHEGDDWVGGYFDVLPLLTDEAATVLGDDADTAVALGLVGGFGVGPPGE